MAYYFSHDSNARNDDKILALRMKHGWEGYGLYWALIERLREAADYACVCDYNVVAYDLRTDAARIKSIIEDFGLFAFAVNSDGRKCFYSDSLRRRMAQRDEVSEKRKNAAIKRWETEDNAKAMQMQCKSNASAMQRKEKKRNNNFSSTSSTPARARKADPVEAQAEIFSKKIEAAAEIGNGAVCAAQIPAAVNCADGGRNVGKSEENTRKCLESAAWVESVCIQNGITPERVAEEIRLFPSHLEASGYDELKTLGDFKRHFMAYLRKKLRAEQEGNQQKKNQENGNGNRNDKQAGGGDPWGEYRRRHGLD